MTALDRFAECCRYVDFKRELIREKIVTYIKGAAYKRSPLLGKDTVTQNSRAGNATYHSQSRSPVSGGLNTWKMS